MSGGRKARATLLQSLCKVDRPKTKTPPANHSGRGCRNTLKLRGSALKTRVLTRKAHRCDVRGAGLWPTGVHERLWNAASEVPPPKTQVLMRKARRADVYWSTLGPAHGAGLATSPVENAAHQVLPRSISRSDRRRSRQCVYPSASRRCPSWGRTRPSRRAGRTPCGRRCAGPAACCGSP